MKFFLNLFKRNNINDKQSSVVIQKNNVLKLKLDELDSKRNDLIDIIKAIKENTLTDDTLKQYKDICSSYDQLFKESEEHFNSMKDSNELSSDEYEHYLDTYNIDDIKKETEAIISSKLHATKEIMQQAYQGLQTYQKTAKDIDVNLRNFLEVFSKISEREDYLTYRKKFNDFVDTIYLFCEKYEIFVSKIKKQGLPLELADNLKGVYEEKINEINSKLDEKFE